MKQIAQTILIGLLLCVIGMPKGYAYDFSAVCETGQTLYYNITNAEYHYVTLTYPGNPEYGSYGWDGFEKPIGNIVLPKYVYDADGNRYIVTSISDFAFYNCSGLTGNLTIPDFVASIGNSAFSGCSGFTGSLTISNSVNLIGNYAFHDCSGFTGNLTIPNSVITIGYEAFSSCRSFTGTLIIPNSVFSIGARAFYKCSQLSSVILSNSLNTISPYLFCECSRLVSVTIPNSVNSIEELAFSFCGQLQHIEIPNSVVSIAQNAFICSELEQIVVASDNPEFDSRDNCNAIIKTNTNELFIGCKRSTIPNTVTSIADNAFFQNAYGLTSIIIPNSVVSIGEGAFAYCRNLFTVNIPNSVISIGADAFFGCGLTSITLGNAVDSIGDYAFCDCQNLSSVYYTGTLNQWCEISFSNDESNPLYYGHNLYINNALVTEVVIPETMNSIGNNVFCGGSCIESITIGNSVESIGNCAFENCTGLTSLFIPNSVISIGFNAFSGCSGLVGPLVIPNALTLIDYGVFKGCDGLTGELVIPNSVTEIGWHAFEGCGGLTSLTIPNSVTKIGWCTFEGCSGLTSLTIPNSVTEIGWHAFKNCSGLTSVTLLCITPPAPTSDSYETFDGSNCPIYVPYESLNDYKTVPNWSDYENRFQPMAYKTIPGYGEGEGNYRFVASPLAGNTDPTTVDNMITETAYDLYRFDQSEEAEWQNYKANNFNLNNGQGYLYANSEDVNLIFKGTFNENSTKTINLIYEAGEPYAGWNLGQSLPSGGYCNGKQLLCDE